MAIVKRNQDDNAIVSEITNGFVIELNGRNEDDDWATEKVYCPDLNSVFNKLQTYFKLETKR